MLQKRNKVFHKRNKTDISLLQQLPILTSSITQRDGGHHVYR